MPAAVEHHEPKRDRRGGRKPRQAGRMTVEERNRHDGQQVVRDGKRGEEHLDARRHTLAQQRQHAQRKGDIRRHRDGPAMQGAPAIDGGVDHSRHNHAAHGCQHGEHGLTGLAKRAHRHLVLELKAHQQEKDRHEEVIDEQLEGQGEFPTGDADGHRLQEPLV